MEFWNECDTFRDKYVIQFFFLRAEKWQKKPVFLEKGNSTVNFRFSDHYSISRSWLFTNLKEPKSKIREKKVKF